MRDGSEVHHADDLFRRTSPDLFPLHLASYRHLGAVLDTISHYFSSVRRIDTQEAMRRLVIQLEELSPETWSYLLQHKTIWTHIGASYAQAICTVLYTIAEDCSTKLCTIRSSRIVSFLFRVSLMNPVFRDTS